jgi:exopolyphosphatase / guanosine-5'-triphosphate,3'-diphosphate pyrophosphatase
MYLRQQRTRSSFEQEWAIIDIGSNTVRLVIFDGSPRAPRVVLNEKVNARLGKGVVETGALAPKAEQTALAALKRYALLLQARQIRDVTTVATAAPRDAANGSAFLAAVAELGLKPRLLSGEAEALSAASGVIGAFPDAKGVVADLGGGSLELVHVADQTGDHGTSLPYGSLRLPQLLGEGPAAFSRALRKSITASGFACVAGETLYLVGGSHRALARYAMQAESWPLDDPHGFALTRETAKLLCQSLGSGKAPVPVPGLSTSRTASLPFTAALLLELIRAIDPAKIVFSSWGLREGLNYARLGDAARGQNPLIAGVADFAYAHGVGLALATIVAGWTANASRIGADNQEDLRLASTILALAVQQAEPNLRADIAISWALRKRWIGISAEGRAMMAACALAQCGASVNRPELNALARPALLEQAILWGTAIRLSRRLGGGAAEPLSRSSLEIDGQSLILTIHSDRAGLINDAVRRELRNLAELQQRDPHVRIETA